MKKIPQMLLDRCEFGRDDYSLNIVHPLVYEDEEVEKMLLDGISCHEKAKRKLEIYAANHSTPEKPVRTVKPFMLVVCKDTDHAAWVESFIKSDEFRNGAYRNRQSQFIYESTYGTNGMQNIVMMSRQDAFMPWR